MPEDERLKHELGQYADQIEAKIKSLQAEVAAIRRTSRDTSH